MTKVIDRMADVPNRLGSYYVRRCCAEKGTARLWTASPHSPRAFGSSMILAFRRFTT
jgi:hypothetical protein